MLRHVFKKEDLIFTVRMCGKWSVANMRNELV